MSRPTPLSGIQGEILTTMQRDFFFSAAADGDFQQSSTVNTREKRSGKQSNDIFIQAVFIRPYFHFWTFYRLLNLIVTLYVDCADTDTANDLKGCI